jgi:hypothetical protein
MGSYNAYNLVTVFSGYTSYFDASGSGDGSEMVVGGFVSTVEEWEQFEISWKLTLAKFDVPYFHMKEFNAKRKAFRHPKWESNDYRGRFMADLCQIIRGWTHVSIASGIKQDLFERYNEIYEIDSRFTPYSLCARDCVAQARNYIKKNCNPDLPQAYIFDRGDEGRGLLMKEMEACGYPSPVFKRSRPDPKHAELDKQDPFHVQLQACDLAAWEVRRGELDIDSGKRGKELRYSIRSLAGMKRIWVETKERDLQGLISVAKIAKRK